MQPGAPTARAQPPVLEPQQRGCVDITRRYDAVPATVPLLIDPC